MIPVPDIALKEVLFWVFILLFVGSLAGIATTLGSTFARRLIFPGSDKIQNGAAEAFRDLVELQKQTIIGSQQVAQEIRQLTAGIGALLESMGKCRDRSSEEHREIRKDIQEMANR